MNYVYHASKTQGLKTIEPRASTHGQEWVYAMAKPEYCIIFIGSGGDFVNQTMFIEDVPCIVERFKDSLEYSYKNKKGSIYKLDGTDFKNGMTSFDVELICNHCCEVINEEKIDDVLSNILDLESQNKLIIYRYPNMPQGMPTDKSDLISRAVMWAKQFPVEEILRDVEKYHPDILDEVKRQIAFTGNRKN